MGKNTEPSTGRVKEERLISLDALRGFDMFWIIGGGALIERLAEATEWGWLGPVTAQLRHAEWHGFRFEDLIFPLFLFIAGVAFPFSLAKRKKLGQSDSQTHRHLLIRVLVLVFLGMVFNGLLKCDWENMRYASVLGRIGLGWFFAALIVMHFKPWCQVVWFAALLLGYWAAMMLIPVPGHGAGVLTEAGNLSGYIDRLLLPGKLYGGNYNPEGILSTVPAIATGLLGAFAGHLLRSNSQHLSKMKKALILVAAGVICLLVGWLWGLVFPINKKIWTSSFVLFAGGWSLLLLGVFYLIIDVWRKRRWALLFVVIGVNAIAIYMCQSGFVPLWETSKFLFGGMIGYAPESAQPVLSALAYLLVEWFCLYLLYKKRIFLKI